jgi:serine protease AprX
MTMDTTTTHYIAIRPVDSGPEMRGADHEAWLSDVRSDLRATSSGLEDAGWQYSAGLADLPPEPDRGGFITLPEFNALVIEPPVGTPEEAVREALADGYVVAPDFALSLPPTALGEPVAEADVRPVVDALPAQTEVRASHEKGNRGQGAVVAVFDSGCDADHREFTGREIAFAFAPPAKDERIREALAFDSGTHGTHVTGIVAGGVVGVAPDVELVHAAVMESDTHVTTALRVMKAFYWLVELLEQDRYKGKPVILNMSLGFDPRDVPPSQQAALDDILKTMRLLMQQLVSMRQILPVVAIGNSGPDTACAPGFFPECLAVGALDYTNGSWVKSSGGTGAPGFEQDCNPDIAGYGVEVVSSVPRKRQGESPYERKSGTSMAAPYVAGIAALVAAETGLRGIELRDHLLSKALDVGLDPERAGQGLARYAL